MTTSYAIYVGSVLCLFAAVSLGVSHCLSGARIAPFAAAALFGTGAYTYALGVSPYVQDFGVLALPAALVLPSLGGGVLCLLLLPAVRVLRDDFLALALVAAQMAWDSVANGAYGITQGAAGLSGVRLAPPITGPLSIGLYCLLLAGLAYWGARGLLVSRFMANLLTVRDDEILASVAGRPTFGYRVVVFVFSGLLLGAAGGGYAQLLGYVGPTSFALSQSVLIVVMAALASPRSAIGAVVGAGMVVLTPELLAYVVFDPTVAANLRSALFGAVLFAVAVWWPSDLNGHTILWKGVAPPDKPDRHHRVGKG